MLDGSCQPKMDLGVMPSGSVFFACISPLHLHPMQALPCSRAVHADAVLACDTGAACMVRCERPCILNSVLKSLYRTHIMTQRP